MTAPRNWRSFAQQRPKLGFCLDGTAILDGLLERSEWGSAIRAIAALSIFVHRDIVEAMGNKAMFRVIRSKPGRDGGRGSFVSVGGLRVMLDDNHSACRAFELATGIPRCKGISVNHLYAASADPNLYANPANIILTPTFLSKLTDTQIADFAAAERQNPCLAALRTRAFLQYGLKRPDATIPLCPPGYPKDSDWAEPVGRGTTQTELMQRGNAFLKTVRGGARQDRAAVSVRQCGWGWR